MAPRGARPLARVCALAALAAALAPLPRGARALDNGMARAPPLGYNTWNDFRCDNITDANIRAVADAMASNGLREAGFVHLNIDDCWAVDRDPDTFRLIADPKAFPDGIKAVADYVHSKGLKFGIYTDRGPKTCAGRPASAGYEGVDAQTFADWGVDYLKEDSCNADSADHEVAFADYGRMRDALNATGRPIAFSLCGWADWYAPVGASLGNSWRISGDVNGWASVYGSAQINAKLSQYAGPGGWNDPDMLVGSSSSAAVHNSPEQARTQFSLWAAMAAPLLIGSNMLGLSAFDLETYTNSEVIAVNQDTLGRQAIVVQDGCPPISAKQVAQWRSARGRGVAGKADDDDVPQCAQVWAKPLGDGSVVLVMVNWAGPARTLTCDATCVRAAGVDADTVMVYDLWQHRALGVMAEVAVPVGADGASATLHISAADKNAHRKVGPL